MEKKINWKLYFVFFILILLLTLNVSSMNSSNYNISSIVVSGGGSNITSANYETESTLGEITGNIASGLYKQFLGFWYASLNRFVPNILTVYPNSTGGESYESIKTVNVSITEPNNQTFNITYANNSAVIIRWFVDTTENKTFQNLTQFNWTGNYTQERSYLILVNISNYADNAGSDYQYWNLTVNNSNTAPTIELLSPSNGNSTTDRTPTFVYNGTDNEGDILVYNINITCIGGCSADNRFESNYSGGENYTPSTDFAYLYDNNYYYNWSVKACENQTTDLLCSDWSVAWTINISSLINITLVNNFINFGSMNLGDSKNTSDDSINPFALRNDGNALTNISINATQLWTSVSQPSEYFKGKARSYAGNASWANTTWFNLPPITGLEILVNRLNYANNADSITIDILLTVPGAEKPENKTSTVNFQSSLAE